MYRILLEIQLTGTNLFTHTTNTWYPRFYEVGIAGVAVVVKYYYMLGNIFRIYQKQVFQPLFIAISYPKNATFVIAN